MDLTGHYIDAVGQPYAISDIYGDAVAIVTPVGIRWVSRRQAELLTSMSTKVA